MVQPTNDWKSNYLVACMMRGFGWSAWVRNSLLDALMRSCLIEIRDVRIEDALELSLLQDQQVIEALLPHAPQEALTNGIGSRWVLPL